MSSEFRYYSISESSSQRQGSWVWNFVAMANWFSINHACMASVLSLASANFDKNLAALSSAIFWAAYTFSALFIAMILVLTLGSKKSLVLGLLMYCCYIIPFAIILLLPGLTFDKTRYLVIVGSSIGGIGAGWLWTAQGSYFAASAERHAQDTGQRVDHVNGFFGAVFSTVYVGWEVVLKVFSSVAEHFWADNGKVFVFVFYAAAAVLSTVGMLFIWSIDSRPSEGRRGSNKSGLVFERVRSIADVAQDLKIWLLGPLNVCFGFASGYIGWYMNGLVGSASVGASNVGYLSAIIPGYAALVAIPYNFLAKYVGKGIVMVLGCCSYVGVGLIGYLMTEEELINGRWVFLVALYILVGNGRAVFESTNRAVCADFFPDTSAGAFSFISIQSGLAGAAGFFIFTDTIKAAPKDAAYALLTIGGVACITIPIAFCVYYREKFMLEARQRLLVQFETVAA